MHIALPLLALLASDTVDGVTVVKAADGGASESQPAAVACPGGACAVLSSGNGLHGFYSFTGFQPNAAVHVRLDSDKGDQKGCSSTISVTVGTGELFGAQDGTCPAPVDATADGGGAVLVDWDGDRVPTNGLVFNGTGTGATTGGEGEGSSPPLGSACTNDSDCGDNYCVAKTCQDHPACSSTASGGPTPWLSIALVATTALVFRRRTSRASA